MHPVDQVLPGIDFNQWRGQPGRNVPLRPACFFVLDCRGKPASLFRRKD